MGGNCTHKTFSGDTHCELKTSYLTALLIHNDSRSEMQTCKNLNKSTVNIPMNARFTQATSVKSGERFAQQNTATSQRLYYV